MPATRTQSSSKVPEYFDTRIGWYAGELKSFLTFFSHRLTNITSRPNSDRSSTMACTNKCRSIRRRILHPQHASRNTDTNSRKPWKPQHLSASCQPEPLLPQSPRLRSRRVSDPSRLKRDLAEYGPPPWKSVSRSFRTCLWTHAREEDYGRHGQIYCNRQTIVSEHLGVLAWGWDSCSNRETRAVQLGDFTLLPIRASVPKQWVENHCKEHDAKTYDGIRGILPSWVFWPGLDSECDARTGYWMAALQQYHGGLQKLQ